MRRFLPALVVAGVALVMTAGTAFAQTNPFVPIGTAGYDTSSYQCTKATTSTAGYSYGIVRVTGGRPFSVDTCSSSLWTQAETTSYPMLYENVAYSKAYSHQVSSSCANASSPEGYTGQYLQAWQIGCGESYFAYSKRPIDTRTAVAWWLDVETGNSWSSSDRVLNEAAIDGAVDELLSLNVPVGVYSYAGAWNTITTGAGFRPRNASGAWVPEGGCSGSFSASLPQWFYQSGTTSWGADADYAC
ncbi:MAG TPA: hypothetical protein VFL27_04690 [Candidatus Dormibacteraeota bacterium]|nr:hypothetical protein [Candidatus Dormibacteraeota bacterium]